jgi:chromate transporter
VLFVALVGWKAAGVPGAFAAMLGICGPSSAMTLVVAHTIERFREARWRIVLQKALAPVTAGLMIASALLLMRPGEMAAHGWILSLGVLVGALALKVNPLWFIAVGALAGATVF